MLYVGLLHQFLFNIIYHYGEGIPLEFALIFNYLLQLLPAFIFFVSSLILILKCY